MLKDNTSILYIHFMHSVQITLIKGKVVPVLNQAPLHEDVLGSGGIASRSLDLDTRWG
jgi:hypothetical protein